MQCPPQIDPHRPPHQLVTKKKRIAIVLQERLECIKPNARLIGQLKRVISLPNISVTRYLPYSWATKAT